jgi:hypothetical protein
LLLVASILAALVLFRAPFHEVLDLEVREVIPVLEATQDIIQADYAELFVIQEFRFLAVPFFAARLFAMVAVLGVVIHQREVESEGKLVDLTITARYHADVLEAFFLKVLNEKPQDALMVGPNVQ